MTHPSLLTFIFIYTYGLFVVSGQNPQYVLQGETMQIIPQIPAGHLDEILWKHNGDKVVEFDGSEEHVFNRFNNRITLAWQSAELNISKALLEDSGTYELEIFTNKKLHRSEYSWEVLTRVAEPSITCQMNDAEGNNTSASRATLACSLGSKSSPIIKFAWRSPELEQAHTDPNLTISLKDRGEDDFYTCDVSNPKSHSTSTYNAKDCYPAESWSPVGIIIPVIVVLLVILLGFFLFFFRKRLKDLFCAAHSGEKDDVEAQDDKGAKRRNSVEDQRDPLLRPPETPSKAQDGMIAKEGDTKGEIQKELESLTKQGSVRKAQKELWDGIPRTAPRPHAAGLFSPSDELSSTPVRPLPQEARFSVKPKHLADSDLEEPTEEEANSDANSLDRLDTFSESIIPPCDPAKETEKMEPLGAKSEDGEDQPSPTPAKSPERNIPQNEPKEAEEEECHDAKSNEVPMKPRCLTSPENEFEEAKEAVPSNFMCDDKEKAASDVQMSQAPESKIPPDDTTKEPEKTEALNAENDDGEDQAPDQPPPTPTKPPVPPKPKRLMSPESKLDEAKEAVPSSVVCDDEDNVESDVQSSPKAQKTVTQNSPKDVDKWHTYRTPKTTVDTESSDEEEPEVDKQSPADNLKEVAEDKEANPATGATPSAPHTSPTLSQNVATPPATPSHVNQHTESVKSEQASEATTMGRAGGFDSAGDSLPDASAPESHPDRQAPDSNPEQKVTQEDEWQDTDAHHNSRASSPAAPELEERRKTEDIVENLDEKLE